MRPFFVRLFRFQVLFNRSGSRARAVQNSAREGGEGKGGYLYRDFSALTLTLIPFGGDTCSVHAAAVVSVLVNSLTPSECEGEGEGEGSTPREELVQIRPIPSHPIELVPYQQHTQIPGTRYYTAVFAPSVPIFTPPPLVEHHAPTAFAALRTSVTSVKSPPKRRPRCHPIKLPLLTTPPTTPWMLAITQQRRRAEAAAAGAAAKA